MWSLAASAQPRELPLISALLVGFTGSQDDVHRTRSYTRHLRPTLNFPESSRSSPITSSAWRRMIIARGAYGCHAALPLVIFVQQP
jgi:hypothetical protein